jgi:hypothetical protein
MVHARSSRAQVNGALVAKIRKLSSSRQLSHDMEEGGVGIPLGFLKLFDLRPTYRSSNRT